MTLTLTRVLLAFVLVLEAFGQVRPADAQPCPFVGTGGTLSTDQGGQGATPAMPVQAAVTVPISGPVCLSIVPISVPAPPGVTFLAQQVDLAVAQADPTNPPLAVFSIDVSVVPRGQAVEMYLNGKSIPPCLGGATAQNPDPCLVSADVAPDGDPVFSVLTVGPGSWTFGATPKPCETAAECDDKNVCTIDACVNARCFNDPAPDGTSCADQDVCNGEEICQKGACVPPASAPCSAGPSIAYLAAFAAGQLVMQPLAAGVPTRTLALDHPWGVAVNPRRPEVYVTERNGSSLAIVDGASGRLTARVAIPGEPLGVAASPDGSRAYVASYKGGLTIVDPVAQAVVTTVGLDGGPTGVAVHPDSRRVYVTNYRAGILTVVDDELHERLAEVHVGRLPLGVAVHPSGTKVYVANHRDGTVSVVGTVSNTVTGTFAVGNKPFAIAFDASGARAYVTNSRDGTVSVVDAVADTVISTVHLDSFLFGVAVDPATSDVCVVSAGRSTLSMLGSEQQVLLSFPTAETPVSLGQFIGLASGCPAAALGCDDGDPFSHDTCDPTSGCRHVPLAPADAAGEAVREIDASLADPAVGPPAAIDCIRNLLPLVTADLAHLDDPKAMARARRKLAAIARCTRRLRVDVRRRIVDLVRATRPEICRH